MEPQRSGDLDVWRLWRRGLEVSGGRVGAVVGGRAGMQAGRSARGRCAAATPRFPDTWRGTVIIEIGFTLSPYAKKLCATNCTWV
jgi:hypothetical protein